MEIKKGATVGFRIGKKKKKIQSKKGAKKNKPISDESVMSKRYVIIETREAEMGCDTVCNVILHCVTLCNIVQLLYDSAETRL